MTSIHISSFETLLDIEKQINQAEICLPDRLDEITMTKDSFDKLKILTSKLNICRFPCERKEVKQIALFGIPVKITDEVTE